MSTHTAEELAQEHRRYLMIWIVLGVLTALEIGVTRPELGIPHTLVVAALVLMAVVKAALVAMYYMHLSNEKTTLRWIAVTPMILCVFLLFMLTPDLGPWSTRMLTHVLAGAPAAE